MANYKRINADEHKNIVDNTLSWDDKRSMRNIIETIFSHYSERESGNVSIAIDFFVRDCLSERLERQRIIEEKKREQAYKEEIACHNCVGDATFKDPLNNPCENCTNHSHFQRK